MTIHATKNAALSPLALTITSRAALGWIELESVQLGIARTDDGVNVASGDAYCGGATAASGQATGRMGRILDPVVVSCAIDSVNFNFTKIAWK